MKITANEAARKLDALNIIPLKGLSAATRVKIVRAQVACERAVATYRKDLAEALAKLKPEGFDERLRLFDAAIAPTDENREQAEAQRATEGFEEFRAEYDKVNAEYAQLAQSLAEELLHDVVLPVFEADDFEDMARVLPSGDTTEIMREGKGMPYPNDEVLKYVMAIILE